MAIWNNTEKSTPSKVRIGQVVPTRQQRVWHNSRNNMENHFNTF